jgi:hypothetical protein
MTMPDLFEGFEKLLAQRKLPQRALSKPKRQHSLKSKSKSRSGQKPKSGR